MWTKSNEDINILLSNNEKLLFDDFIDKMMDLNIFEINEFGEYIFVNISYYVYFLIMATFNENF